MGNSHQMIVHYVCKIVSRVSVGLDQDHIVKLCVIDRDIPVDLILKGGRSLGRVVLADNIRNASRKLCLNLFLGKMQTVLVIYRNLFSCYGAL